MIKEKKIKLHTENPILLLAFGSVEPQVKSIKNWSFGEENFRPKCLTLSIFMKELISTKNHFNQEPDRKLRKTFFSDPE